MANRSYKQFMYSQERMPVMLMGSFEQDGATGSAATLTDNGITYTANEFSDEGNNITVALIDGGTAGSEAVSVSGTDISVQIQDGVSTRTQVKAAIDASSEASELISVSVSSGGTAATLMAATNLAGGADTDFIDDAKDMSIEQLSTGVYKISFQDQFFGLLSANFELLLPTAKDREVQIASQQVDDSEDPSMVIRVMSSATPTDLADNEVIYCQIMMRNSGS